MTERILEFKCACSKLFCTEKNNDKNCSNRMLIHLCNNHLYMKIFDEPTKRGIFLDIEDIKKLIKFLTEFYNIKI